jgi:hypothetical protein
MKEEEDIEVAPQSEPAKPAPGRQHRAALWHESFPADPDMRNADGAAPAAERLLDADLPVHEGVRRLVALFNQSLLANVEGAVIGSNSRALHDLRIAIRRIRTVLRAFRKPLRKTSARRIDDDLRDLNRCLGPVRDLDAWIGFCEKADVARRFSKHRLWPRIRRSSGECSARRSGAICGARVSRRFGPAWIGSFSPNCLPPAAPLRRRLDRCSAAHC